MLIQLRQRLNPSGRLAWLPLVCIVALVIVIRIPYLSGNGFGGDLNIFQGWVGIIRTSGLFHFYEAVQERSYPPISTLLLATSSGDITSIKLPSVMAEVLIVIAAYWWLRREKKLRWLIPVLLALHPGLIITTAWWGQNEALFTLAIVLVLVALNRDRPLIAWVLFGVALATKQQSIVIAPLIVVLSFRRYGWRRTIAGGLLALMVVIGLFLPFALTTGFRTAFSPYLVLLDGASSISNNAYNLWYAIARFSGIAADTPDRNLFLGALSYNKTALLLLGGYTLLLTTMMWKRFDQRREFVWASALYMGSFMLQTQIHERYLYPATILALLAIKQERRMGLVALGIALTFSYNVIDRAVPTVWLGVPLVTSGAGILPIALLNVILLMDMLRMVVRPIHFNRAIGQVFVRTMRITAVGLVLVIFFTSVGVALSSYAVARWLGTHVADHTRIAVDLPARYTMVMANDGAQSQTWEWRGMAGTGGESSSAWLGDGVQYLVVDMTDEAANHYWQERFADEPMTLLYEYQSPLRIGSHLAVLWTFRPDYPLDVTFDNSLVLIGYHVLKTENGTRLLFHWYTQQTTTAVYTAFIHLVDPQTGALLAQADMALGGGSHPTDTWRPNELVFETVELPAVNSPYLIRMGLYQLDQRAAITDSQGNALGDHIDFSP